MEMTAYNNYHIMRGRWNPWTPDDLAAMATADAQIEAEYAARKAAQMKEVRMKKRYDKPLSPEKLERKRAKNREYHAKHRYERNEASREWHAAHSAPQKKRPADVAAPDRAGTLEHQQYNTPSPKMQPVMRPENRKHT